MDINIIVTVAGSFVTAALTSLFSPLLLNYYLKKKFQKLQYINESFQLYQSLNTEYKTTIIEPAIQENLFLIISDFRTNHLSIPAYVELKDKLGKDFDWPIIKSARPHLRFDQHGKLYVKLSRTVIYMRNLSLGIAVILALLGFSVLVFLNYANLDDTTKYIAFYIFSALLFMLAFVSVTSVTSVLNAGVIANRLKEVERTQNSDQ
ncbi:hypothetical protein [Chryseobacterium culicis]|uniref:hypothetical protein n=1 Tax=Chryseobacterium culicis TaxID=680127 RepID=UPI00289F25C5|nr:hypothetical protein [Chryseobacterium culicis]